MLGTQRWLGVALALCITLAIYFSIREIPLPEAALVDRSITGGEPLQEPTAQPPFTTTNKGYTYTLTPRAIYDIAGLVVSQHDGDSLLNLFHKADPGNIKDVCLVWGEVITNGAYRQVRYWSEEFSCYYQWSGSPAPPFHPQEFSNNHLLPADAVVARAIRAIRIGDQIRMRGLLVDYAVSHADREVFTRRTSLTRTDTGNGACEILYVTSVDVLRPGDHLATDAAGYAWWASLGALVGLGAVWFRRPHEA
jgi:hypothetical protein